MYGKKFKEIRIKQNISLEQAAKDVVSISTLSRWENDKLDINFSQLNHLLANIHLTLREFARYCEINPSDTFSIKAAKAYNSDDINQLHALAQQLDKYYSSRDRYDLFLTAIANNYYFDLTQKKYFLARRYKSIKLSILSCWILVRILHNSFCKYRFSD